MFPLMASQSFFDDVSVRLSHYARTAVRPGGLRYFAKRVAQLAAWHSLQHRQVRAQVASMLAGSNTLDVLCVGHVADRVAPLPNRRRAFAVDDRVEDRRLRALSRAIGERQPAAASEALIIYANVQLLSVWEGLEQDLDLCFAKGGYRQIILVFGTGQSRPLSFAGYSYVLPALLNSFPRRKFSTRLEVFAAPQLLNGPGHPRLRSAWKRWRMRHGSSSRTFGRGYSRPESASPTHFSVLMEDAVQRCECPSFAPCANGRSARWRAIPCKTGRRAMPPPALAEDVLPHPGAIERSVHRRRRPVAQPFRERDAEPLLAPLERPGRQPGRQRLAKEPLALAVAQLEAPRQAAAEFDEVVVEEDGETNWFMNLDDARRKCEAWRRDYNEERPHSTIGNKALIELIDLSAALGPR